METKLSDSGWLCGKVNGEWVPICKLSDDQTQQYKEVMRVKADRDDLMRWF